MENTTTTGVTPPKASEVAKAMSNAGSELKTFNATLNCSIRRRPSLIGLPGTDPNDRVYKIGSSMDLRTRKNLKGIDGVLEEKFMPAIIGVNITDNSFQTLVNEYWGNISTFIPADESFLREDERGKVLKIDYSIEGDNNRKKIESEIDIESKVEIIKKGIEKGVITLSFESIPDFILLCFALKYSRVAKDIAYLDKSPKIHFYIYNKSTAVKVKLNAIELRSKAINLFTGIRDQEERVNSLLVMFNLLPNEFDNMDDKLIALDMEYNRSIEAMERFVNYAEDDDLQLKYIIKHAVNKGKLHNPPNTESYYYNKVLIGTSLLDAVLFLKDDTNADATAIKKTLIREIKE